MRYLAPLGDNAALTKPRIAALGVGLGITLIIALILATAGRADAEASCPNSNPIVNENQCKTGSTAWRIDEASHELGGYPTQTSVNLGEPVTLKIARNAPTTPVKTASISIFRMGYYEGAGGRLVNSASNVSINNNFTCEPMDQTTGEVSCANWAPTYTIPGSAFPTSGIYMAKVVVPTTGEETQIVFTVRDDSRQPKSKILFVLPMATYAAYNIFGGKSLYFGIEGGNTVAGTGQAVKVSFDRPFDRAGSQHDWFLGPDFDMVYWLERQGYEVSYTDDVHLQVNPQELKEHNVDLVSGHSEYWSLTQRNGFEAARDAGVNIASFSANTSYWKVRYEDNNRTLVCYKTVEGGGAGGSGAVGANDWGPDGIKGTADDAAGPDGIAGTADDNPQNATTTWRDNGAPPGDPNAPPGGRVGPNRPENELFGIMYVGDNDARGFPVTVPPGNANDEYAANRVWRNTGISENSTTDIGSMVVNWEWDAVPTQPQYLSHEPAGVKKLSATNVQVAPDNSWIQDEGRARNTQPPPGQPGIIGAAEYTAPSGAEVFAAGTIQWAYGLSSEPDERLQQATYNILSDMGAQPATPDGITLDPGGSNRPPNAGYTVTPNPTKTNTTVTFNAAPSNDPDGSIVKYEWDLDGNGSFETNTGTKATATRSYTAEGAYDVRLRVTDNGGATDVGVQTVNVINNQPPTARFLFSPESPIVGESVTFNGSTSSDPDGTIAKYEWDLDGNGTYETNSGSSSTVTHSYTSAATKVIGLRVTDNGGKTATTSTPLVIGTSALRDYSENVLETPGLAHYWRMGETSGTTLADSVGASPATISGGVTLGAPGAMAGDPDKAANFNGQDGTASAQVDLSKTHAVTVEFWLKHNFVSDDHIAMELTNSYHQNLGGFLIDPDAPQLGGKFAVGIGMDGTRNTVYFERPTSNVWHHYAFVLDSSAPAAQEILPYVDGSPVEFTKLDSGTGAGNFANSTLNIMSRAGNSLFGEGTLDELAIYDRGLSATTISDQLSSSDNRRPTASFTGPTQTQPGQQVTFDASASKDLDGTITTYEWDLDGDGTYETNTGSTPTVSKTYSIEGKIEVGLRVTDNGGATATAQRSIAIGNNEAPSATFTAAPNPVTAGQQVNFDASASKDPDGTISAYEWDLDGNGTYETKSFQTDAGANTKASNTYTAAGEYHVALRVTDNKGASSTTTKTLVVEEAEQMSYADAVRGTPGLLDYWRMSEPFGPAIADSVGSSPALASGNPEFSVPGGVPNDPNTAISFNGNQDAATAAVNLSGTSTVTVEFWMKWDSWANDDDLAFEYTPNFNGQAGGFLIDPNSSYGSFAVALGVGESRNVALFARPTAGAWHHYAFVLNTSVAGPEEITPYVDGAPVAYSKAVNGTGAGNFANSNLYFMSRSAEALFGAGDLDDVALYNQALSASTIAQHYGSHGGNRRPVARFQGPVGARNGEQVSFDASTSSDPDGSVVKYEWDLDGNGSFETNTGSTPTVSKTYSANGTFAIGLRVTDDRGATATATQNLSIGDNQRPEAAFSASPNPAAAGEPVSFDAAGSRDPDGSIVKYEWDLDGNGSFETNTGSTPTVQRTYGDEGEVSVGLRVTDTNAATATTTRSLTIAAPSQASYADAVRGTPGLLDYWRMSEPFGPAIADSVGSSPALASGNPEFSVPGGVPNDPNTAISFNGNQDAATAAVNLSGTSTVTVEFWMKWDSWANDDDLAFEYTPNFNGQAGGFLIDPNSSYGSFAVALGVGESRNVALFARPTAGAWHHYAFVLNTSVAGPEEITPYVDGAPVAYSKAVNGTGAGNFANSNLYFMSRSAEALFGAGDLDDVALYNQALSASTIAQHYGVAEPNAAPKASFSATPNPAVSGATVTYNASASSDPDGSVVKYEWDLDGNGSFETNTGSTPTANASYPKAGSRQVGLKVTDNRGSSATASRSVVIQDNPPNATFTAAPNPAPTGQQVSFDASASSDPDGSVVKYEWDLDGNGSFETSTGTSPSAGTAFPTRGDHTVGLRVTDDEGAVAVATRTITVQNRAPTASLTVSPNPAPTGSTMTFDASGSSDPDGTIASYEWDLDGNGSFETNTGATPTSTKSYSTPGNRTVGVKITDDAGATAVASLTATVENRAPSASFTAAPNPVQTGATVTLNGSASSDPDGTIAKYEWDLDGNGSYETSTGTTPTASTTFATKGDRTVGLRVTDNSGATAATTRTVTVQNRPPVASFTATPNPAPTGSSVGFNASGSTDSDGTVASYEWDLDGNGTYETSTGPTASSSQTYATAGNRTVGLRITDNEGATATTTRSITIQNRPPTASFTVSPNPVVSGSNTTFNASGSTDPDGTVTKYEWDFDGNGSYETSTGTTPTSTRSYSTPGTRAVGLRVTDNSGSTATTTVSVNVQNRTPAASFTFSPTSPTTGTAVTFNGSGSSDPDGTISKWEWDWDNNGSYDSSVTGSSTTHTFTTPGTVTVGLRVTDNSGGTATTTRSLTLQNHAPTASFTPTPNPVSAGSTVTFNASGSSDPDGTIAKYEWDLDGNGSYEKNTGTTATTTSTYSPAGTKTVGLRVTDNLGATATTTQTLTVRGPYQTAVVGTSGLIDYWRLGETSGTSFTDAIGAHTATARNGITLGTAGPLTLDSNTAATFDGSNDNASVALNLSGTQRLTIEFWMKWSSYANNDDLALEFTSNFNNSSGGFIVNPNSSTSGGRFEVALGRSTTRNSSYFTRPSAGVWHHYAFVLNTSATASQQVIPYVDGQPVSITKGSSGTGGGNFANSTLNFMSRNGSSLYGAGSLDELAIYNQALTATQIAQHYAAR